MSLLTPYVRPLVVALLLACSSSCAWFKAHGGTAAVDCASEKLATRTALVVPLVLALIEHDDKVAADKAIEAGKLIGFDVLGCAIQHVHLNVPAARDKTGKLLKAVGQ